MIIKRTFFLIAFIGFSFVAIAENNGLDQSMYGTYLVTVQNVEALKPKPKLDSTLSCTVSRLVGDKNLLYRHINISQSGPHSFEIMHYGDGPALSCTYLSNKNGIPITCHVKCKEKGNEFDLSQCLVSCHSYDGKKAI